MTSPSLCGMGGCSDILMKKSRADHHASMLNRYLSTIHTNRDFYIDTYGLTDDQ